MVGNTDGGHGRSDAEGDNWGEMRIVHILTRLLRAGSEENTLLTCAGQLAEGHQVVLMHGHEVASEHALGQAPGAELLEIPELTREVAPPRDLAAFRDIRRRLVELKPDVVHTHQSKAGIVGRFAAAAAGVPLIVHGVHILPFLGETGVKKAAYLGLERAAARVTDGFIHVSEGMKAACLGHGIGTRRRHYVVRSGFDLRRFAEARPPDDWREILGLRPRENKPPVIAMLAALEPRKRHLELLGRLQGLLQRFDRVLLVFAGEGHLREQIQDAIVASGLQQRVALLGFRDDPERIIAMADLCIHCSDKEGLPRSVLQYLAAGRPTVMFHLPGIEEVIADGDNGVVVAQEDWEGFNEALATLITDENAREAIALRASQIDLGRWDAASMAAETLAAYDDLSHRRANASDVREGGRRFAGPTI
jgi:glycosyltransferase involved in cell wall biosynthesis